MNELSPATLENTSQNSENTSQNSENTPQKTSLYPQHKKLSAKIIDFGGWLLPVNYGSQIEEHHAVRNHCGVFDVSHMTVSDITGIDTINYLGKVLANDIRSVVNKTGKALYSCMLNNNGGVIDDLIVYYLNDEHCRLVTNAGTHTKDMAWLTKQAELFAVEVTERTDLALIAVQGPEALTKCQELFESKLADTISQLSRFQGRFFDDQQEQFVGRTGYTGEDGIELIITSDLANQLWEILIDAGVQACGLGARDTLRLEAGMSLYGNDLDEQHNPIESGLTWTVKLTDDRNFLGKGSLNNHTNKKMVGLVLLERGVLRGHQKIYLDNDSNESAIGEITSGSFSPTLEKSIALARISNDSNVTTGQIVKVAIRNKFLNAEIVPYPFVKNGKPAI